MAYDERLASRVRAGLSEQPALSERKMFGGICFLLGGHMCCGIQGDELVLRVAPQDYEAVLEQPGVRPMDFTGRPLRGMVYVRAGAIASDRSLRQWLQRAAAFARSLPPKAMPTRPAGRRKQAR